MNIVVVGSTAFDSLESHIGDTLVQMGHRAVVIGLDSSSVLPAKARYWLSRFVETYDQALSRTLVTKIIGQQPDLVLVVYRHLNPVLIQDLKQQIPNCPVAQFNPDALTNLERQQIIASPFDFYFTKEPYMADAFRQKAGLNAHYIPEAFNPLVNKRLPIARAAAEDATNTDVLMYGNLYPYRARMVTQLIRAGIRPTIFGLSASYLPPDVRACFVEQYLAGEEKNRMIYGSRIAFNNMHYAEVTSANNKYFEINGTGGFQLCDYKPTLHEYSGIPVDKVTFGPIDEAIDKIRYYLAHPDERHRLADQQHAHFQLHHTYQIRLTQMLSIINGGAV